ncbi:glycine zipper 2TM domain-containing protein [Sulfuriferula sp. GW1]|uniref:glycine zipper 2TM domain-containing protein n=1 Tax=Sulfuriferula sp. GW1 TaxID=3345111 RepID=UPI0039AF73B0
MRTTQLTAGAIALMALSTAALADRPEYFNDRARVLSSTPIYQQVNEPRRECWTETVDGGYRNEPRSYGGALIGGVVGGLLGNTVGRGNGRTAAAAVGAVTGALVGDNISNNGRRGDGYYQPRQVERCQTRDNYRQVVSGYNVVYRYRGRNMSTTLPYNPGRFIDVNVAVAENRGGYGGDYRGDYRGGYRQVRQHRGWNDDNDD